MHNTYSSYGIFAIIKLSSSKYLNVSTPQYPILITGCLDALLQLDQFGCRSYIKSMVLAALDFGNTSFAILQHFSTRVSSLLTGLGDLDPDLLDAHLGNSDTQ